MWRALSIGFVLLGGGWLLLPLHSVPLEAATYIRPNVTCSLPGSRVDRSSPVAADVNGDGTPDIIVAGNDGRVYAVDSSNCEILWSKQVADYINPNAQNPSPQDIESSPTVADLDGDGNPEIVLTTGWMPESHKNGALLVLDHNGNLMPGWPRLTRDVNGGGTPAWNPDGYADGFFSTPAVGDIDGDRA